MVPKNEANLYRSEDILLEVILNKTGVLHQPALKECYMVICKMSEMDIEYS